VRLVIGVHRGLRARRVGQARQHFEKPMSVDTLRHLPIRQKAAAKQNVAVDLLNNGQIHWVQFEASQFRSNRGAQHDRSFIATCETVCKPPRTVPPVRTPPQLRHSSSLQQVHHEHDQGDH
jgi:hypothetical protein